MTGDLFGPLPAPDAAALIARLCGGNARAWARALKAADGNVRAFLTMPRPALAAAGVELEALERFALVAELAAAYGETRLERGAVFKASSDVYAHFRERLARPDVVEHFILLELDNKHQIIGERVVGVGSLTASIVHPRDVIRHAIVDAAAAVIFVHNHPSGDPTPSREDLEITKRLRDVCDLVGIRCLDHIIIGAGRFVSFVDDGYW